MVATFNSRIEYFVYFVDNLDEKEKIEECR